MFINKSTNIITGYIEVWLPFIEVWLPFIEVWLPFDNL